MMMAFVNLFQCFSAPVFWAAPPSPPGREQGSLPNKTMCGWNGLFILARQWESSDLLNQNMQQHSH